MRLRRRFSARQLDEQVRTIRVLGVLGLGMACVAMALWLAGADLRPLERAPAAVAQPVDPLRSDLDRCNAIGSAALDDAACKRVWAESRRRFFGGAR